MGVITPNDRLLEVDSEHFLINIKSLRELSALMLYIVAANDVGYLYITVAKR